MSERTRHQSLGAALAAVRGQVHEVKLAKLEALLSEALPTRLRDTRMDDPILVRRQLVKMLKARAASRGNIQAMEQFFMGVMRRAALAGYAPTPPEGPWTRAWQHVLDLMAEAPRGRAACRALAGWATLNDLDPREVGARELARAVSSRVIAQGDVPILEEYLERASKEEPSCLPSDELLAERLRLKAAVGSTIRRHVIDQGPIAP